MFKKDYPRKRYPSDLTDEQWVLVEPLLPPPRSSPRGGRPRQVALREVLNTLLYLHRSGCQWDMLPHDLLPKSTVYDYFAQWRDDGTWAKVVTALRERTRVAAGRAPHMHQAKPLAPSSLSPPVHNSRWKAPRLRAIAD
jgi:putative transposase